MPNYCGCAVRQVFPAVGAKDPGPPPGFELTAGDVEDITTTDKRKEYQCHKLSPHHSSHLAPVQP